MNSGSVCFCGLFIWNCIGMGLEGISGVEHDDNGDESEKDSDCQSQASVYPNYRWSMLSGIE